MLNPILASSALRRMRTSRAIVIVGAYASVLMLLACLGMGAFIGSDAVTIGDMSAGVTAYTILLSAQFALIVLVAPAMTAGAIAGERERQTLELLLVTNTCSFSIVLGKLMESFAFLALLIVSGLPAMCLTMMLGGVTLAQILTGMLFLLCCAFAAASVGILCSSFMRGTVPATVVSYILILLIGVGTLVPIATSIDRVYDSEAYAALSQAEAMKLLPKLLYVNPGIGLVTLIESQTAMFLDYYFNLGRMYATVLLLQKIGCNVFPFVNMAAMLALGSVLVGIAAALVRPRRVRVRRKR